jgi:3-phosphoshikimate 1-carboxyvinyltransferase
VAALIVRGSVVVPGDKSISHRALIAASLADGSSSIRGILQSADVQSTAGALRALGVEIPTLGSSIPVSGVGLRGLRRALMALDCGNSGTSARLLAGVCAALPVETEFIGDSSLSRRPMRRVARPLRAMGAHVDLTDDERLPMWIRGGALHAVDWVSDKSSAQVKSAVLLAGLVAGVDVSVSEPQRSRDHTERMLTALGADVEVDGLTVRLSPAKRLMRLDMDIPSDPSSAAFFAALAALADEGSLDLPGVCLNPTRTGFFRVLARMGADVGAHDERDSHGEPVGTLRVAPGELRAVEIGAGEVPSLIDELPLVACLAARAEGETTITGASELRVKESDRIATVVANLRAIGADADELPDGMLIRGAKLPLRGRIVTHGDHRIAMAFGVLGAVAGNAITVDDPDCCAVSFPGFWRELERATRGAGGG